MTSTLAHVLQALGTCPAASGGGLGSKDKTCLTLFPKTPCVDCSRLSLPECFPFSPRSLPQSQTEVSSLPHRPGPQVIVPECRLQRTPVPLQEHECPSHPGQHARGSKAGPWQEGELVWSCFLSTLGHKASLPEMS